MAGTIRAVTLKCYCTHWTTYFTLFLADFVKNTLNKMLQYIHHRILNDEL